MISYAKINLQVNITAIQQQVAVLASTGWKAHINQHDYEGEWKVLPLRSPGGEADNIVPDLMGKHTTYLDTPLMQQCPAIKQLLDSLHCEVMSARLLNLKKGAVIKQHRDVELAFEKGEARLHFPIFTNHGVEFYVDDERVIMLEGECWYINANLKHRVTNNGPTDRIHLVVDCKVNAWLEKLFEQADKKMAPPIRGMEDWHLVIKHLKERGTDTDLALADDMEVKLNKALAGS
ncbi:MAG: aspartyl/asparaginyl beta-hydroxylase domain-containing protein [Mucilaginibacter sp.]